MGAASHTQMDVRLGKDEIFKKGIGHIQVIVLPSMNDHGFGPILFYQGVIKRGYFHEVGPGGCYKMNKHDKKNGMWPLITKPRNGKNTKKKSGEMHTLVGKGFVQQRVEISETSSPFHHCENIGFQILS
jgi:hypothetical protein